MITARPGRGRATTAAIVALAVGGLSYAIGVLSGIGQRAEASVLSAAEFTTNPPPPLNLVSIPSVTLVLALIGGLALAVHGIARAAIVVLVPLVTIVASQLLKQQFLQRPGLFELDAANTFPSGHMTVFTVIVGAIIWAVPARGRAVVSLLGAGLLAIVAWQLIAFGWHRPSDVLGSLALGIFAFAMLSIFSPGKVAAPAAFAVPTTITLTLGGFSLVVTGIVISALSFWLEHSDLMLFGGELALSGAAFLSTRILLGLADR